MLPLFARRLPRTRAGVRVSGGCGCGVGDAWWWRAGGCCDLAWLLWVPGVFVVWFCVGKGVLVAVAWAALDFLLRRMFLELRIRVQKHYCGACWGQSGLWQANGSSFGLGALLSSSS